MSQEKVAKYKETKANRKEIMKKEKRARRVRNTVIAVVGIVVLGWVGVSGVQYLQENKPRLETEVDFTAIDDYTSTLVEEEKQNNDG